MLADADLAHLQGHRRRLRGATRAEEARDGGRSHHRERAETDRLDDGAVAHVRVRVSGGEPREVETLRHVHGRGEPARARPRDADAEVSSVAGHHGDERRAGDAADGLDHRLAGRHRDVQEELIVAGEELGQARDRVMTPADLRDARHQRASEQRGGRQVALVHLVAHPQRLRHQRAQVDAAKRP